MNPNHKCQYFEMNSLRQRVLEDLKGVVSSNADSKDVIRHLHSRQRSDIISTSRDFLNDRAHDLLWHFASGYDISPSDISPRLERVSPGTWQSDLFRMASLTWSVPVSQGFGRRMRYIVWDNNNRKLMGIIALGDPVFNLSARDDHIGWKQEDRNERLVNIMDAYVLGALPPYNSLLCGKLVSCMIRSRQVYDDFITSYGGTTGIISGKKKRARLLAVTTSSSMGRSSVYNRLKLGGIQYFKPIGYTKGWGHFHISDELFLELRDYLRSKGHKYADSYRYGQGSNFRIRVISVALRKLGISSKMIKHGIKRQVFISLLASNAKDILLSGEGEPDVSELLSTDEVASMALDRWVVPRSVRRPEYKEWNRNEVLNIIGCTVDNRQRSLELDFHGIT